jgi:hypothetical protein
MAPVAERAAAVFVIRGTEAHAGQSGADEEEIAAKLGAAKDDAGLHSRYDLWLQLDRTLVNAAHHIGTTGSMAYETSALMKEITELFADSARWGDTPPDVVVRSHRHRHALVQVPTRNGYGIVFTTGAWQLRTPFSYRVPGGRVSTPHIGMHLIRCGDEEAYTRHRVQTIPRSKTARPRVEAA